MLVPASAPWISGRSSHFSEVGLIRKGKDKRSQSSQDSGPIISTAGLGSSPALYLQTRRRAAPVGRLLGKGWQMPRKHGERTHQHSFISRPAIRACSSQSVHSGNVLVQSGL